MKEYEKLEMEIIAFLREDVILTSNTTNETKDQNIYLPLIKP